jgi:acyl-CoA reductase-like NAD-dependent aldehyde dehydrogenase
VIAEFPLATAADVRTAIDAAVAAWPAWKKTPGPERGRVLWRAADISRRRVDEIAKTLTREEGKILKEAKGEVLKGISLLEYYAGEGFRMHGKTLPSESRDTFTYTIRQPLGVVGLIAPWNFPWAIPGGRARRRRLGCASCSSRPSSRRQRRSCSLRSMRKRDCLQACSTCWSDRVLTSARRW